MEVWETKIKRCPCCSGKPVVSERLEWWDGTERSFWVECESCGLMTTKYKLQKFAVEAWNRRAGDEDT